MSSRESLASAFMCSHKPPRVTQTKCVFLISAAEEPGNFVLIKTSRWFRDGGAHARTGSAGGWRFLGSVSAAPLTWPALTARNQGLVCDFKSCCFADRTRLYHNGGAWGNTQMKHSLGTSRNVSTTISTKWGDRFLWRPIFNSATAISLMFGTVTFRCVRENHRAGGQRFGFRLQKEAIIKTNQILFKYFQAVFIHRILFQILLSWWTHFSHKLSMRCVFLGTQYWTTSVQNNTLFLHSFMYFLIEKITFWNVWTSLPVRGSNICTDNQVCTN